MEFWEQKKECMSRNEIEQVQLERLQSTLNRVYKNVKHYKNTFRQIDFMPEDLKSLEEFKKLPFTSRQDLKENYPYGMFAVPLREIVRLHAPALTLDNPLVMGFTANDLNNWGQLIARNLTAVGVTKEDVVQVSLIPGKLIGPFGMQSGTELVGASAIPMSVGKLKSQIKIMRDFRTTVFVSTPSFALDVARSMESMGVDPVDLSLKCGIFGSEPWSETTRDEIESKFRITAADSYSLTEVFGPGVAWECSEKNGLHISEDHFFPEIVDPETLQPLAPGSEGELVLTTLTKEAFPLIRFRTGDKAKIDYSTCACGRTHCRISRIFSRCDGVIVMKGTSIVPENIGRIIFEINGDIPNYQLVVEQVDGQDRLTVQVEISDKIFFDEMKKQRRFIDDLHKAVSGFLGWEVNIKLVEPGTFDAEKRVMDKRSFEQQ